MWENIERKYFGEGRINLFKIGEPECSLSSLLILSSLSTSSMISSLMICKTFLNRPENPFLHARYLEMVSVARDNSAPEAHVHPALTSSCSHLCVFI